MVSMACICPLLATNRDLLSATARSIPVNACYQPSCGERLTTNRGRRMVCYDGSGVAAAKLALVLTLLGHDDAAVYDGGWAEWGNRLDLPVDR